MLELLGAKGRGQAAPGSHAMLFQGVREYLLELSGNSMLRALVILTAAVIVASQSSAGKLPGAGSRD